MKLADRRVFLQIVQGDADETALVRFFEQQQDGAYTVTEWHTKRASTLLADIDREICANKGVSCVGEQIKLFLQNTKRDDQHVTTGVAAPASVQAAFAHPVNEAKGVFIKTVLTTLC